MQQERTECRAFGVVPSQNVTPLASVLRGMCSRYDQVGLEEVVLSVPMQGGAATTQLRLSRPLLNTRPGSAPSDKWLVQHEGIPLRGPGVAGLPAAVREITDSYCTHGNAPEFFMALGARQEYKTDKQGNEYLCMHEGYELQVFMSKITTTVGPPGQQSKPVQGGKYIIDVRVRVPDGQHMAAAQAIGSFGTKLTPLVTLQPALLPIPT